MAITLTLSERRLAIRANMDATRAAIVREQRIVKATRFAAAAGDSNALRCNLAATSRIIELSK